MHGFVLDAFDEGVHFPLGVMVEQAKRSTDDVIEQGTQLQVLGVRLGYAQSAPNKPAVAIRSGGDEKIVTPTEVETSLGRCLVVVGGVTFQAVHATAT